MFQGLVRARLPWGEMGDDGGPGAGADTRLFWMEERISNALRLKPEKLKALQASATRA